MSGWNLKNGELCKQSVSEEEYWTLFNFVFSDACLKRNTYKFGLIKSIMDNLFNCTYLERNDTYILSYEKIFEKFTVNYWNLVLKYHLKQMRPDGKSKVSKIESIILNATAKNEVIGDIEFDSLLDEDRNDIVKQVSLACRRNVIGALYNDMDGKLYGFDIKGSAIHLAASAYNFMFKYKAQLEKLNYYAWAKFMEKINDDDVLVRVLDKLELSTPKRSNLSVYREVLFREFEECNCFYCGKRLSMSSNTIHVDHFIPWSFVKDDKLWNFVLSCSECNGKKSNKIPSEKYLRAIIHRNERAGKISNPFVKVEFENYTASQLQRVWKYSQLSGMKQFVDDE